MTPPLFQTIRVLKETPSEKISLVLRKRDQTLWIQRELEHGDFFVFESLKKSRISGIPAIEQVTIREGRLVVLEEYIQAPTLDTLYPVSERQAADILCQLCDILDALHHLDPPIIHRDIKPENIFYRDGKVILFDFDIARQYDPQKHRDTTLLGSAGYASPEQFGFDQSGPQSDIYSCGKLFLMLLTGKIEGKANGKYASVIEKAVQLDPHHRYETARQFKADIQGKQFVIPGWNNATTKGKVLSWVGYILNLLMVISIDTSHNTSLHFDFLYLVGCFSVFGWLELLYCNRQRLLRYSSKGVRILAFLGIYFALLIAGITILMILDYALSIPF